MCTLGFVAYTLSDWRLLTAGHCFGAGTVVSHPGTGVISLVRERQFQNGGRIDAEAIYFDGYRDQISNTTIRFDPAIANVDAAERQQLQNKRVCKSGISTNETCFTVTRVHIDQTVDGVMLHDMIEAFTGGAVGLKGGDSGGPVYYSLSNGSVSAEGIVSARNDVGDGQSGNVMYYSFIQNIAADMGVYVLSAPV